jgi:CRISPR type III-A/MTUBE-associated protein Csm6
MTTLFSPIGTADPITQLGDGPMLNIVRERNPDVVVLYLSPAMAAHQDADGRYTRAIELLSDALGRRCPDIQTVRSGYDEVYRFDYYIEEFERVLERLCAHSTDPVLVNVTSGTPAMEQALVALGAFGRLRMKLLQVTTPRKGVNARSDREDPNSYDLQAMWEWNQELPPADNEGRIVEVTSPNFADRLLRENVIAAVERLDYEEAYRLARQMTGIKQETLQMIKAAADRMNLNGALSARVFGGTNDLLSEYLYVMEARLEQGHYAEFVRSMTPALTRLAERKLRPYLPERAYLQMKDGYPTNRLNLTAIAADQRLSRVFDRCTTGSSSYVTNEMLMCLLDEYCKDEAAVAHLHSLREMERSCRNRLAHELQQSERSQLEKIGGLPLDVALRYLFELHGNMKPGLYRRISQMIVDRL